MKETIFLGIDIGGTNIKLAGIDGRGKVLWVDRIETRPAKGAESAFARIKTAVEGHISKTHRLKRAGIGCAGLVDVDHGVLNSSPNLRGWKNAPLARIAKEHLGVYTSIDNDANMAAYGEYRRGCGRDAKMLICITLGTGVGGGIIANGEILRGKNNYAGEVGHMTIDENGPPCKCGNRGCLEAFVGADALVRTARELLKRRSGRILKADDTRRSLTPRTIADAAHENDRVALQVYDTAARHLGTGLASLINIFDPDVIALGGGVAGGFDLMKKRLYDVVRTRAFRESRENVRITRGHLGNDAASIGAACVARDGRKTRT